MADVPQATSSELASNMIVQTPRLRYYISRPDGTMTPLIAVDELPASVRIVGVPTLLLPSAASGLHNLGNQPKSLVHYVVEGVEPSAHRSQQRSCEVESSAESEDPGLTKHEQNVALWRKRYPLEVEERKERIDEIVKENSTPSLAMFRPRPKHPDDPKIYCQKWIQTGECAFTPQGCKYKHEMPDLSTLASIGFPKGVPRWYQLENPDHTRQIVEIGGRVYYPLEPLRPHRYSDQLIHHGRQPPPLYNGQGQDIHFRAPAQPALLLTQEPWRNTRSAYPGLSNLGYGYPGYGITQAPIINQGYGNQVPPSPYISMAQSSAYTSLAPSSSYASLAQSPSYPSVVQATPYSHGHATPVGTSLAQPSPFVPSHIKPRTTSIVSTPTPAIASIPKAAPLPHYPSLHEMGYQRTPLAARRAEPPTPVHIRMQPTHAEKPATPRFRRLDRFKSLTPLPAAVPASSNSASASLSTTPIITPTDEDEYEEFEKDPPELPLKAMEKKHKTKTAAAAVATTTKAAKKLASNKRGERRGAVVIENLLDFSDG